MGALRRIHLCLSAVVLLVYAVGPDSTQSIAYLLLSLSAPVAIVIALKFRPQLRPGPWILLAVGFGLYFLGDLMVGAFELADGPAQFPNAGDVAYLLFYPVIFGALAGFLRTTGGRDRAAWIDATIWSISAFLLAWEPLIEPSITGSVARPLAAAIALAYPLLDIGLLLLLLRIVVGRCARTRSHWLLIGGLASQTAADAVYSMQVIQQGAVGGRMVDLGLLLMYVLVGAAALDPSMTTLTDPTKTRPLSSRTRLVTLLVPTLLAPALLVYKLTAGELSGSVRDGVVIVAASTVLTLLGVARAAGLLSVAELKTRQLERRQATLEAVLADGERSTLELHRRVNHDALTGLASRERFVTALEAALASGPPPSVAFLDLDDFKTINDTLGHDAGDLLLITLSQRLHATAGPNDLVARFGGDEFAILVTDDVEQVAETMLATLRQPVVLEGRELRLQVSIGVTTAGLGKTSTSDMLRRADMAMYAAKRAGGGWARYQTGMSALLRERMDLRARLVTGLGEGEIQPWFQPVVDIASGELRGFEALARWMPDDGDARPPGEWLPIAEETGLVVSIDRAVCRSAVTQFAVWRSLYKIDDLYLAINMSARTLQQRGVAEGLINLLGELAVPPNRIVVEVTEGVLMDDDRVSTRLQMLRAAGIRVALDDFGTGWSSLSYLQKFPVDQLKLDRSFTAELCLVPDADAIPAAVLQLARALSLDVVAEGVETPLQLERLADLGFRHAQGFLFGQAEPAHLLVALLRKAAPRHGRPILGADEPEPVAVGAGIVMSTPMPVGAAVAQAW